MFDTLEMLLKFHGPEARAVVWEHNSHVGNAAATEMSARGEADFVIGSRTLFWSGLCFAALTLTNLLVIADHYLFRHVDLTSIRLGSALVAEEALSSETSRELRTLLELQERYDFSNLVGTSGPMRQVYEQIAQVAA